MSNQALSQEELNELRNKARDLYYKFIGNRWNYLNEAWKSDLSQEYIEDGFGMEDYSVLSMLSQLAFLEYISQKLLDEAVKEGPKSES